MAKSASDRLDRIRALLARNAENVLDEGHDVKDYEIYEDEKLRIGEAALDMLREFVDQATEPAPMEAVALGVIVDYLSSSPIVARQAKHAADAYGDAVDSAYLVGAAIKNGTLNHSTLLTMVRKAVEAGEQYALERWEPDEWRVQPRTVVDPDATSWSFNVEEGLVITWEQHDGEHEFVLQGDTSRTQMVAGALYATEVPTPFPDLVARDLAAGIATPSRKDEA